MLDGSKPIGNEFWSMQLQIHNHKTWEGEQEYHPLSTDFVSKSSKLEN